MANGFECVTCGTLAFRRLGGSNRKRGLVSKYCSRACYGKSVASRYEPKSTAITWAACSLCQGQYIKRHGAKYCRTCKPRAALILATKANVPIACRVCGSQFCRLPGAYTHRFCSEECNAKHLSAKVRAFRAKAKAIRRGVERQGDHIDPLAVFAAAKWRCQICGVKTPRDKRGTYAPDAPELDHVVPLSKGGMHTLHNVQCACRRCNIEKADALPAGQLGLFAAMHRGRVESPQVC